MVPIAKWTTSELELYRNYDTSHTRNLYPLVFLFVIFAIVADSERET